ncbi:Membrane-associated, eicosanoid/glutathione metabolism (MAPEG) protein [Phaffia rhodozyma]|uniref:Membrane-associated, eicosanoid/glutathione metabolism (MAPEG) protein n=1 Tax=Phaffia rhodozyma TaxID=264483 RepID=A0A0F7SJL2_PHARH|nr:Membrane-associated, eicosanoid/glutathione metabolism (MAPEG) protein [Phaffia rhodozyma]
MPITVHSNLSLYAIPTVWALAFAPHTVKLIMASKNGFEFDNTKPRGELKGGPTADAQKKDQLDRLAGAHVNGIESFPLFATAIIIGNFARLPAKYLNIFSGLIIFSRASFIAAYYYGTTARIANIRSGTYFFGVISSLTVLVQAANKVFKLSAY